MARSTLMAVWHDPLDELIADLEVALPASKGEVYDSQQALLDLQVVVSSSYRRSRLESEEDPLEDPPYVTAAAERWAAFRTRLRR
jgi:hypothetical protein